MEFARTTILSTTLLYKDSKTSFSMRLLECEGEGGAITFKFGIVEHSYNMKTRQWVLMRNRVEMPVSAWSTLVTHGQRIIDGIPDRESTKHDQATETSACDNSDAARPEMSNVATELHEPQLERVVKVIRVECEPPRPVEKAAGKPRGRPRKRPEHVEKPAGKPRGRPRKRSASPAATHPAKRVDVDNAAQQ